MVHCTLIILTAKAKMTMMIVRTKKDDDVDDDNDDDDDDDDDGDDDGDDDDDDGDDDDDDDDDWLVRSSLSTLLSFPFSSCPRPDPGRSQVSP